MQGLISAHSVRRMNLCSDQQLTSQSISRLRVVINDCTNVAVAKKPTSTMRPTTEYRMEKTFMKHPQQ